MFTGKHANTLEQDSDLDHHQPKNNDGQDPGYGIDPYG